MSMTILSRLFLVERYQRAGEAHYRLHPHVHGFLCDWAIEHERFDALRADIMDTSRDYLDVHGRADDAVIRLMTEMENLLAAAEWAADNDDPDLAADLAQAHGPTGRFAGGRRLQL